MSIEIHGASRGVDAFEPTDIEGALRLAVLLTKSGLIPSSLRSPEAVLYVILAGRELGFSAVRSIRELHIIDGKIVLAASAMVASVCQSGRAVYFSLIESTERIATYETQRVGAPAPTRLSYTIEQASKAGLTSRQNWQKYPDAMLRARCSAALARIVYPDAVAGMHDTDEAQDFRSDSRPQSATVEQQPEHIEAIAAPAEPTTLDAIREAIESLGGSDLSAEQAAAIWVDHHAAIVAERLQEPAGEMLASALAPKLKTKFGGLLRAHERDVSGARRAILAAIADARTEADLIEIATNPDARDCGAALWARRIALCTTATEIEAALIRAESLRDPLRSDLVAQIRVRARALGLDGPDDDGPDGGERVTQAEAEEIYEAIEQRGTAAPAQQLGLPRAIDALRGTHGPQHTLRHYLRHRDELATQAERSAYRAEAARWLRARYPRAVASVAAAEQMIAEAEQASTRRIAA